MSVKHQCTIECLNAAEQMIYVTCRPLLPRDIPKVVALDECCFNGLWSSQAYQRECESPNSDLLILEAVEAQEERSIIGVGCLWAILEEAHITLLGIDPVHQRQGLGRWVLTNLLLAASDRGLSHATLEVRQSNQTAQRLYQIFGFQIAGKRRRYYSDGEDALILWRGGLQTLEFSMILREHSIAIKKKLRLNGYQVNRLSLKTVES